MEQLSFEQAPTIVNVNEHHMALLFLLDVSGSMNATIHIGDRQSTAIEELNRALGVFKNKVCEDEHTADILDVAIISFNDKYRVVQDFLPIEYMENVMLRADGATYICKPLDVALEKVNERSRLYRKTGTEPYKPWIVIITDGMAMDEPQEINAIAEKATKMAEESKVAVWSLAVGPAAEDEEVKKMLHKICGKRVLKLEGYDFEGFLEWTNKSMRAVSVSSPGDKVRGQELPHTTTIDELM